MSDSDHEPRSTDPLLRVVTTGFLMLLGLVVLLYLPLLICFLEMVLFRSHHFEEFLRTIHLHEPLGYIYKPVVNLIRGI